MSLMLDLPPEPAVGDDAAWRALVTAEPALGELEREIRATAVQLIRPDSHITIDRLFYGRPGGYKQRLLLLVGWHARRPELRTADAYEVAITRLFGVLEEHEDRIRRSAG